jgi:hypothetical protein
LRGGHWLRLRQFLALTAIRSESVSCHATFAG